MTIAIAGDKKPGNEKRRTYRILLKAACCPARGSWTGVTRRPSFSVRADTWKTIWTFMNFAD